MKPINEQLSITFNSTENLGWSRSLKGVEHLVQNRRQRWISPANTALASIRLPVAVLLEQSEKEMLRIISNKLHFRIISNKLQNFSELQNSSPNP